MHRIPVFSLFLLGTLFSFSFAGHKPFDRLLPAATAAPVRLDNPIYLPFVSKGAAVLAPVLLWQNKGCYNSWCETGWYSSPAVADVDGDNHMEVIGAAYTTMVLDGATGSLERRIGTTDYRVWPGVVVADLDGTGSREIVIANGGGYVNVYDHAGAHLVWSRRPSTSELRGLAVANLDGDSTLEVIVNAAVGNAINTWVYNQDGALRAGWPQLSNSSGYAAGVYNQNTSAGDLDGDHAGEIVVPSDVHYINAYEANGTQIPANSMYGSRGWGLVGIWESLATELRSWGGDCNGVRAESYRANFADGASDIVDVNQDGEREVVVTGNVYDCHAGYPPSRYTGVYIFNADRSRFHASGFDWSSLPINTGAPLSENYNVIETAEPNPVVADLDGDGNKEILFASYDGRMHAFWLDKTEHGSWPYSVYTPSEGFYRFASEPAVADLDNNGHAEVIFTSWTQKSTTRTGKLHILDYLGNVLYEVSLPPAYGSPGWNGALAAPTLADIDGDGNLEVVVNTALSGLAAYRLPATSEARVLWGTGRGNYLRNGTP